jgi:hypothetical protein
MTDALGYRRHVFPMQVRAARQAILSAAAMCPRVNGSSGVTLPPQALCERLLQVVRPLPLAILTR